jgi:hypothetical protein
MTADDRPAALFSRQPAANSKRSSICVVCGTQAEPGARFCIHCGSPFENPLGWPCPACQSPNLLGEAFCETCGAPLPATPYLVVTVIGLRLPLPDNAATGAAIGRSDPLSGVFPDIDLEPYGAEAAGLSRQHARITHRDNQYWLEDLNSVNLTYLNNQRLIPDRPARLKDGDLLRLGQLLLTFRVG